MAPGSHRTKRGAPYPRKHRPAALYGAPAGSCAWPADVARFALGIGADGVASGRSGEGRTDLPGPWTSGGEVQRGTGQAGECSPRRAECPAQPGRHE